MTVVKPPSRSTGFTHLNTSWTQTGHCTGRRDQFIVIFASKSKPSAMHWNVKFTFSSLLSGFAFKICTEQFCRPVFPHSDDHFQIHKKVASLLFSSYSYSPLAYIILTEKHYRYTPLKNLLLHSFAILSFPIHYDIYLFFSLHVCFRWSTPIAPGLFRSYSLIPHVDFANIFGETQNSYPNLHV